MAWTSPVGLFVEQPYRKESTYQIRTKLQRITLSRDLETLPVDAGRQRSAFPPNFIHSIDAAHMLRTAVAAEAAGLDFAAVHDSYWTHAGHVPRLNALLREEFVRLHTPDLSVRLVEEVAARHPAIAHALPAPPPRGDFDIRNVLQARYFFS